jgi:hypothetical protein
MTGSRPGRLAPWLPPCLLVAAVLAFYGPLLGRYFTSEDFLLVRFLRENPPWRDLGALFGAPWLEISVVKFWRPISTLLYGIEIAAFGGHPAGYNVVHVLVHALNAVLVWALARRLQGDDPDAVTPLAAAFLFAIYPLHPNAVIFGASFATLFATTFLFGAALLYLRFRENGARSDRLLALGLFALGLGSYEAAAVLPAVLAAWDHLRHGGRRHLSRVWGYFPFFVLLGLYFLLRKSLFGVFVGGYEEQSRSLTAPRIGRLLRDLELSLVQLHAPLYDREPGALAQGLGCVLLIGLPLVIAWAARRTDRGFLRRWLCAWVWTLATLAPFAFQPSVPGDGRYWYLAAAGVALSLAFVARAVWAAIPSRARVLGPVALGLFGLFWAALLVENLGVYSEAGRTARQIQQGLLGTTSPGVRFLTGYPLFLTNERGVPVAQVYHYGVWDAVHPPFVQDAVPVYPLPRLAGAELLPVRRGAPESRIYGWDAQSRKIREVAPPPPGPEPVELEVSDLEVKVPPGLAAVRFRLIVLARGNWTIVELGPEARVALPEEFCQTMVRLYGEHEMFWWVEARGTAGELVGFTQLRGFRMMR